MRKLLVLFVLVFFFSFAFSEKPDIYINEITKGEPEFVNGKLRNFDFNISVVTDNADVNGFEVAVRLHDINRTPMKTDYVESLKTTEKKLITYSYSSMVIVISGNDSNKVNGNNSTNNHDKNTLVYIEVDSDHSIDESNEINNIEIIELVPPKIIDINIDNGNDVNIIENNGLITDRNQNGGWVDVPPKNKDGLFEGVVEFLNWLLGNLFLFGG